MNDDRIIQIIPAPADMYVKYRDEIYNRVVCLALMEYRDSRYRYVELMDVSAGDGMVQIVEADDDFRGLVYKGDHQ